VVNSKDLLVGGYTTIGYLVDVGRDVQKLLVAEKTDEAISLQD
jgi:hypothetical protein